MKHVMKRKELTSQRAWKWQNWEIDGFENEDKNKEILILMTYNIPFIKEKGIFQASYQIQILKDAQWCKKIQLLSNTTWKKKNQALLSSIK